jgi:tetratricopeptide (TPR) repeat protein
VLAEEWELAVTYLRDAGRLAGAQFATVEAISCFERALEIQRLLPATRESRELAFDIHRDLRNALVPLGRHARLLEVLESARALAEELDDDRRRAQVLSYLSNYYGNVGRSDLALETGERTLVLGKRVGALNAMIVGNMSAGEIHRTLGDYPKAREHLEHVIALLGSEHEQEFFGQVGLPSVRTRSHLAWVLAELGDFERARATAAEALRIADASHHPYSVCHACLGLGGVRVRAGEFEAAIPILTRGLAGSEQIPLLRPPLAADLGVAHARCGRIAEGLSHVDAAVAGATSMGRMGRLPLILVKCAEIHLLAGESAEALRLTTTALSLATEQKERGNEVYARFLRAEIRAHDAATREDAAREFDAALALATELRMRPLAAHCHAGLARLCARSGDGDGERAHLDIAAAMYGEMAMRFWLVRLEHELAH